MEMESHLAAESDIVSPFRRCPFMDAFTVSLQWTSKKNISEWDFILSSFSGLKTRNNEY